MGRRPNSSIPSFFNDHCYPRSSAPEEWRRVTAEREKWLKQPRELLLDIAQRYREGAWSDDECSFPVALGDNVDAKKTNIRAHEPKMIKFNQRGAAEEIEAFVQALDAMLHLTREEAIIQGRNLADELALGVWRLMWKVRGEAEYGMSSPADVMLKAVEAGVARDGNTKKVNERRERLRPWVEEMAAKHPTARAPRVITELLKRKEFRDEFPHARATLNADAEAILKNKFQP